MQWCDGHEHSRKLWARSQHFVANAGRGYALDITFPGADRSMTQFHPDVRVRIATGWLGVLGLLASSLTLAGMGIGMVQTGIALGEIARR